MRKTTQGIYSPKTMFARYTIAELRIECDEEAAIRLEHLDPDTSREEYDRLRNEIFIERGRELKKQGRL